MSAPVPPLRGRHHRPARPRDADGEQQPGAGVPAPGRRVPRAEPARHGADAQQPVRAAGCPTLYSVLAQSLPKGILY